MVFYELAALRGVLAHVEAQQLGHQLELAYFNRRQVHGFRFDKLPEFIGVDFAESFEAGSFCRLAQLCLRLVALVFGIAVNVFLFIAHAEQRRFKDEDPPARNQLLELLPAC